jgi:hypothetical protein
VKARKHGLQIAKIIVIWTHLGPLPVMLEDFWRFPVVELHMPISKGKVGPLTVAVGWEIHPRLGINYVETPIAGRHITVIRLGNKPSPIVNAFGMFVAEYKRFRGAWDSNRRILVGLRKMKIKIVSAQYFASQPSVQRVAPQPGKLGRLDRRFI